MSLIVIVNMRVVFNLSREYQAGLTSNSPIAMLVRMMLLLVNLVILIEMAALTSLLPDTAFTLLDSCIWSVDAGYRSILVKTQKYRNLSLAERVCH